MLFNIVKLLAVLGLAAIMLVPTSTNWAQGARQSHSAQTQARAFNSNAAFNPRVSSARSARPASAGDWTAIHGAGP